MPHVRRGKDKPTESARAANKAAAAMERRRNRGRGVSLNLESLDADTLKRAIIGCLQSGLGVTLGITRDSGALSVTLLDDGTPTKDYVRATENLDDYFTALAEDFSGDV